MHLNKDERNKEQERVTWVSQQLDEKIQDTQTEYQKAKAETQRVQKDYGTNTSANYLEADDRIETSADLQQQRSLTNKVVEDQAIVESQLATYRDLRQSPYFGRIDIQDEGFSDVDHLYIGKASFIDKDGEFLIYDWRAPISSVYYNGTLGKVAYDTPNGKQNTDLLKKRQFQIKNGKIINMFDTNETVGDELLQSALSDENNEKMQNIVATIQHEQNDIIRDTNSNLLVVQGVAGSGKTSALLQRIAFLLYHSRDSLNADQILLFSPNLLFSNYIKDVLPSLGERNMRQVTLAEFFAHRLEGMKVQTLFQRYEDNDQDLDPALREFKNSQNYIDQIEEYVKQLTPDRIKFDDIHFNGEVYFSKDEIREVYAALPQGMTSSEKLLQTKNKLIKRLKNRIHDETKKKWVADIIDTMSDEQYHNLLGAKHLNDFEELDDERDYIATQLVKNRLSTVYDAIYNDEFLDPYVQYADFLDHVKLPNQVDLDQWKQNKNDFLSHIEFHQIGLDDTAPLLYLRDRFSGENKNVNIKYLFVDEIQDYSIAQIMYLKLIFPRAKFNLIGDSEQAIFKDVESAQTLLDKLNDAIPSKRSRLIQLNRSYRSTYPITSFAKSLLPDGNDIEAFNRNGDKPELIVKDSSEELEQTLLSVIKQQLQKHETVAVITKDAASAKRVYQKVNARFDATLLKDSDRDMTSPVVVLPVYLAKGLEFDSVVAWDTSKRNYPDEHSLGVLYTILTRAMHSLTLLCNGEVSPLIPKRAISNNLIKISKNSTAE
ncbi:RNA polymerase recycling motor HelD [Fructilactobacillus fructivorans]|uniref:RNA polymerase recycling motor HelD n=1 Tax=Fructilactobacillus fructivorans TaxID=1614 RepID=UPI00223C2087|nr:RNA polymerase recycling motor HelD [Fructilactobacillus fructivorans]